MAPWSLVASRYAQHLTITFGNFFSGVLVISALWRKKDCWMRSTMYTGRSYSLHARPFLCSQNPNFVQVFLMKPQFSPGIRCFTGSEEGRVCLEQPQHWPRGRSRVCPVPLARDCLMLGHVTSLGLSERILKGDEEEGAPLLLLEIVMSASCYKTAAPVLDLVGGQSERSCWGWRGRKINVK